MALVLVLPMAALAPTPVCEGMPAIALLLEVEPLDPDEEDEPDVTPPLEPPRCPAPPELRLEPSRPRPLRLPTICGAITAA